MRIFNHKNWRLLFYVWFYIGLLVSSLSFLLDSFEVYLSEATDYSETYEPITLNDLPTVTLCLIDTHGWNFEGMEFIRVQECTSRTNAAQRLVLVVHSTNIYSSTQLGLRVNYCSAFCSSTFTAQYQYSTGFFRAQLLQLMTNTAQSKGHTKTVNKPKESKFKKFLMYFM